MIIVFEELQVSSSDGDYVPTDEELAELYNDVGE
jgi:hypothetical protein